MSRRPAIITQADISRAIRAAEKCDPPREVVVEPDGRIRIIPFEPEATKKVDQPAVLRL